MEWPQSDPENSDSKSSPCPTDPRQKSLASLLPSGPYPSVLDYAITGPFPMFDYCCSWHECQIIHALKASGCYILVVGAPDNGTYEWVIIGPDLKISEHSNCGYGISESALKEPLAQLLNF